MEIVASTAYLNSKYKLSTNEYTSYYVCKLLVTHFVVFCFICAPFTLCCYEYFDKEDYRNRRRAAEVSDEEAVERLESVETSEEVENCHEISVPTDHFTSDFVETNSDTTDN